MSATAHGRPLELLVRNGEYLTPHRLEYTGGARYPRLERDRSKPDLLAEILRPQTPGPR